MGFNRRSYIRRKVQSVGELMHDLYPVLKFDLAFSAKRFAESRKANDFSYTGNGNHSFVHGILIGACRAMRHYRLLEKQHQEQIAQQLQ